MCRWFGIGPMVGWLGMVFGLLPAVLLVGVLFAIFLRRDREDPAVRALKLRLAEGAISREEFDERMKIVREPR